MATKFSPKDPTETILLTYDFSNLFSDSTEIIVSVAWSIEVISGVDATPESMISGTITINNTSSSRLVSGGVDGVNYNISVAATTNKGQILKLIGSLLVEAQH